MVCVYVEDHIQEIQGSQKQNVRLVQMRNFSSIWLKVYRLIHCAPVFLVADSNPPGLVLSISFQ